MLNLGVIGAGGFSSTHLEAIAENAWARVLWIADTDKERADMQAERYEVPNSTADYREMLEDDRLDAVDILTPHHLHCSMTLDALKAGLDVICIKPMAVSLQECWNMKEAADRSGRTLIVSFHQRYDPVHRRVQEMLASGEFEQPVTMSLRYLTNDVNKIMEPGNWYGYTDKCGGGRLFSGGSHRLDILVSWLGEVEEVTARTERLVAAFDDEKLERRNRESDDHAFCIFASKRGVIGDLRASFASPVAGCEKYVYGRTRALHVYVENGDQILDLLEGPSRRELLRQPDWRRISFQLAIDEHIDVLRGVKRPLYSLDAVLHSMDVLFACYRSSRSGRRIRIQEGGAGIMSTEHQK